MPASQEEEGGVFSKNVLNIGAVVDSDTIVLVLDNRVLDSHVISRDVESLEIVR